jgi:hypothetical protein
MFMEGNKVNETSLQVGLLTMTYTSYVLFVSIFEIHLVISRPKML